MDLGHFDGFGVDKFWISFIVGLHGAPGMWKWRGRD